MKFIIPIALFLNAFSSSANYQISIETVDGVQLSQTVIPDPQVCTKKGLISVSIHQPGSNSKNIAKAAKAKGGNFVFIRYDSSYYSYTYGGDLYDCTIPVSSSFSTYKK